MTEVAVAVGSIAGAYVLGYFMGRSVGREQGAVDVYRKVAATRRLAERRGP